MRQSGLRQHAPINILPDCRLTFTANRCRFRTTHWPGEPRITLPHAYLFAFS